MHGVECPCDWRGGFIYTNPSNQPKAYGHGMHCVGMYVEYTLHFSIALVTCERTIMNNNCVSYLDISYLYSTITAAQAPWECTCLPHTHRREYDYGMLHVLDREGWDALYRDIPSMYFSTLL